MIESFFLIGPPISELRRRLKEVIYSSPPPEVVEWVGEFWSDPPSYLPALQGVDVRHIVVDYYPTGCRVRAVKGYQMGPHGLRLVEVSWFVEPHPNGQGVQIKHEGSFLVNQFK